MRSSYYNKERRRTTINETCDQEEHTRLCVCARESELCKMHAIKYDERLLAKLAVQTDDVVGVEVDDGDGDVVAYAARHVGAQVVGELDVVVAERVSNEMGGRVVVDGLMRDGHAPLGQILEELAQRHRTVLVQHVRIVALLAVHVIAHELHDALGRQQIPQAVRGHHQELVLVVEATQLHVRHRCHIRLILHINRYRKLHLYTCNVS